MIKTFRGQLADDGQDRIRLQTIKGKVGYKIVKFEIMAAAPGATAFEHVMKIYKTKQTSVDGLINFSDSDLLGMAFLQDDAAVHYVSSEHVIFDQEVVNQDIYITHADINGALACNYYLELEVIPLDDAGAEYTTLKDMRQV